MGLKGPRTLKNHLTVLSGRLMILRDHHTNQTGLGTGWTDLGTDWIALTDLTSPTVWTRVTDLTLTLRNHWGLVLSGTLSLRLQRLPQRRPLLVVTSLRQSLLSLFSLRPHPLCACLLPL